MKYAEWAKLRDRALQISDGWLEWSDLVIKTRATQGHTLDDAVRWQQQLMESHPKLCEGLMLARLEARQ